MPLNIVADENIAFATDFFAPLGNVTLLPGRSIGADDVKQADILLVRSVTPVNASLLSNSDVKFVGSCTIGADHLDTDWLVENQITYACAPGCNAQAVVDYVCAALKALSVPLNGTKTVGIVGCGNVGSTLLRQMRKSGIRCYGYDPFLTNDNLPLVDFQTLLGCDVICLHTPLTRAGAFPTWHLFDAAIIEKLKPGCVLISAGRGAVIDNAALLHRLQTHNDLLVVLDVWENEPDINADLLARVAIGTPHIAGYSFAGKLSGTQMVYTALCQFLGVEEKPPVINTHTPDSTIAYDPRKDCAALREQFAVDGAKAFDRLRRHYRPR